MLVIFSVFDVQEYAYHTEENAILHHSRKSEKQESQNMLPFNLKIVDNILKNE